MSHPMSPPGEYRVPPVVREIVLEPEVIQCRVRELAREIENDYGGAPLLAAGILNGAAIFLSDLVRQLRFRVGVDLIAISRYSRSPFAKEVRITKDLQSSLRGVHLLLVEDLVDTGLTLHYLIQTLVKRGPASVRVCTLLERPSLRLADIPIGYSGFHVSEEFLIGYGLDYRNRYRELPYIASMRLGAET